MEQHPNTISSSGRRIYWVPVNYVSYYNQTFYYIPGVVPYSEILSQPSLIQGHYQVPEPSYTRNSTSHHLTRTLNGPRYQIPNPSNVEPRMYQPQQTRVHHAATENRHNLHLRILPQDEVAILDFSGYHEAGNFNNLNDMQSDVDSFSYEELLALEVMVGNVKIGLTEETILSRLKTRIHISSVDMDQETETCCVVCQYEHKNQEKIGILDCGHEYHADCIKQWLLMNNLCPICKRQGLAVEMDGRN